MRLKTGAVVVAAGLSSRMKAFKPLLPFGNATVIRTVITKLRAAGASIIAVVTGYCEESLRENISDLGVNFVSNADYKTTDMFHSVCLGLDFMKNKTDRLFLLPADVPFFEANSLALMTEAMDRFEAQLVIPSYKGKNGHPVLVRNTVIPRLIGYQGKEGLRGAIANFGEAAWILDLDDRGIILDADSREDYRLLLRYERELRQSKRFADR